MFCVFLKMRRNSVVKNVGVCYFRHLGYHLSLHIFCDVTECHHQNGVIPITKEVDFTLSSFFYELRLQVHLPWSLELIAAIKKSI